MPLLWQDEKGLPPTPDTLHLGRTYHLHSSHRFFFHLGCGYDARKKKKISSVVHVQTGSLVPKPKSTVIGLGARLMHIKSRVDQAAYGWHSHSGCQGLCRR